MNRARRLTVNFVKQVKQRVRKTFPPRNVVECLVEAAQREIEGRPPPFEAFYMETVDQHRIRILDGLKAIKERYQDEFGIYAGFAPHYMPERVIGAVLCEHTYVFENRWKDTQRLRDIGVLRVGATLAEAVECQCAEVEFISALSAIGIKFTFEEFKIWQALLGRGHLEEALYLEYGATVLHGTVHPNQADESVSQQSILTNEENTPFYTTTPTHYVDVPQEVTADESQRQNPVHIRATLNQTTGLFIPDLARDL
jgi:hypothetical protein